MTQHRVRVRYVVTCDRCGDLSEVGTLHDASRLADEHEDTGPCQGRCEFHGRLWCKETGRPCSEFIAQLENR